MTLTLWLVGWITLSFAATVAMSFLCRGAQLEDEARSRRVARVPAPRTAADDAVVPSVTV